VTDRLIQQACRGCCNPNLIPPSASTAIQLALASVRLGDRDSAHRVRSVRPPATVVRGSSATPTPDASPSRRSQDRRFRSALVGQNCAKQSRPCVLRFRTRAQGFVACPVQTRLHPAPYQTVPLSRTSDALPSASSCWIPLLLVRPFTGLRRILRPRLTSRSGSTPSPFQA
jgi:hypothetical protein